VDLLEILHQQSKIGYLKRVCMFVFRVFYVIIFVKPYEF